jgi:outer membrane immunogenic protein
LLPGDSLLSLDRVSLYPLTIRNRDNTGEKNILGAVALVALGALPAFGADLPTKAPVYKAPAAVWSWTGFFLGANLGGAWTGDESFAGADPFNTFGMVGNGFSVATTGGSSGMVGVAGGFHGGYNWQVTSQFLLGIEADVSGTAVKFSTRQQPLVTPLIASDSFFTSTMNVRGLASVRGRAGLVIGDWLLFGTGGWGWADTHFSADMACPTTGLFACTPGEHAPVSADRIKNGAVFGGGFEYHLPSTPCIIGAEYLRYQLNGSSFTAVTRDIATGAPLSSSAACPAGTPCVNYSAGSLPLNEVRIRASYQFGSPVVARY